MTGDKRGISVCIIAKNEERNLPRALGSVEDVVDEIIVVDTGSTDNTVKIAKSFGAKVVLFPWNNNFSDARNKALENATKDWILQLDADEAIDVQDGFLLRDLLLSDEAYKNEGFCFQLTNIVEGKKTLNCTSLRIFRNRKEFRFRGRIHEQIYPSMQEFAGENCVKILDYKLYHYGYDKEFADILSKQKRNIEIFNSTPEEEKDAFFYYNLASEHLRAGNLREAIKFYQISDKAEGFDNGFRIFLPIYIIKAYYDLGEYKNAIIQGEKTLMSYPNFKDLLFIMTACYYNVGEYVKAKACLLDYVKYSKEDFGYPEFYFDNSNDIPKLLRELDEKISGR